MSDTPSRIIGIACVLLGVWIVTYWVYQPVRAAPKITLDELPQRAPMPKPVVPDPAPVVRPAPVNLPPQPVPQPKPARTHKVQRIIEPQFRDYLVQKGDTSFERVAARKEVFGDAAKAAILGRANPMFSPDRLKPGVTVLQIPQDPDNIQGKLVWVDEAIPDEVIVDSVPPKPAPPVPPTPAPEGKTYTIQKDDTLWSISEKFYGKGALWPTIAEANKDVIPNPDRPPLGGSIRIPPAPASH